MNLNENSNGRDHPVAAPNRGLEPFSSAEASPLHVDGGADKCLVCGKPIEERCFCKLYPTDRGPIALCCPSCAIQYIESARAPSENGEEELRGYEKKMVFFIGEEKPWP